MKITTPCPFQPKATDRVEGGFHCSQCQRIVYDMRDQNEIHEADWKEGKRCGIFRADQLQPVHFSKSKRIYFAILLVLAGWGWNCGPLQAQEIPKPQTSQEKSSTVEKGQNIQELADKQKLHWWQFRKKRKKRRQQWIGCPSF